MSDKELLELAAKAAELDYIKNCVWIENGFYSPLNKHERISWNPLTDDGDALRLMVKLEMQVSVGYRTIDACIVPDHFDQTINVREPKTDDLCAATRRAIVRAAAEIGRTLG